MMKLTSAMARKAGALRVSASLVAILVAMASLSGADSADAKTRHKPKAHAAKTVKAKPKSAPVTAAPAAVVVPEPIIPVDPAWPAIASVGIADPATEARVTQIMGQMTLEEKVGQMVQADINFVTPEDLKTYPLGSILAGGNSSPGQNERASPDAWLKLADDYWRASLLYPSKVKIPLLFGIDAVHGHSNLVGAVIFPHNVGLGAAHDPDLIKKIGQVTAEEMSLAGVDWTFAPTVAVSRDKRWGRSYESYSENPADVGSYSGKMVEGLQGDNAAVSGIVPGHIMSTAKHFLGDGGTEGGKDQGDAVISEADLADIHNGGYPPAIKAGVLSVMASFSSWNGQKITGNKQLLTGVLKQRMGFEGFVVTDWNAQGQVPGCTEESCPQAINAGIDMFMAPNSWKAIYGNTLKQAKSGEIPMSRIDDAVRRILRAKIKGGLFTLGAPKDRALAGQWAKLGSAEHRAVARQAVRESLVLLKNNGSVLPIKAKARILVTGSGADDIGKQAGGWTITWQGTGNTNADFPNGQSIWAGFQDAVAKEGGIASLSVDGVYKEKPDVAVVVIGEDPYAEFKGDRTNLDYQTGDRTDLKLIQKLKKAGIPVVTVFLSGRPLWVNPEINASDAFVAAWLPGTEGGGIADVLVGDKTGAPRFDFKGKLSFSWPKLATQQPLNLGQAGYDPQFAYGYGLTYADKAVLGKLSEDSGLKDAAIANTDDYFVAGKVKAPWKLSLSDDKGAVSGDEGSFASPQGFVAQSVVDVGKQEAGRALVFNGKGLGKLSIAGEPVDLSRQATGELTVALTYRLDAAVIGPVWMSVGRDATTQQKIDIAPAIKATKLGDWKTLKVTLNCFKALGVDMKQIGVPFALSSDQALSLSYSSIRLASNDTGDSYCPVKY